MIEPEMPAGWKINPYWLRYSASTARNEYEEAKLKSMKQVAIMLEPGKHAGVDIVFEIDNVIRGKVIGQDGNPMLRVCVHLVAAEQQQEGLGSFDCTDEKGRFEITSVPSGEYVLVANQDGKLSSREPFRRLYYPNVWERERAAVISIGPGGTINDLNFVVPHLEETITVEGWLRYSDGKPVAEERISFKAEKNEKIDGDVNESTDAAGRFSMKILKGLKGELSAEDYVYIGKFQDCPKLDSLIKNTGRDNTTIKTNVIHIQADQNLFNLELTFPFPGCNKKK